MDKQTIRAIYNGMQDAKEPFELWTILEPNAPNVRGLVPRKT